MKFHKKLRQLREMHKLTQNDVAEKLFVTRQAVYKWERGDNYPDIENLKKLANIYSLSVDDLLDENQSIKDIYNKGGSLLDRKSIENLKWYINHLPHLGLATSAIAFIFFFLIVGVTERKMLGVFYCLVPLGVHIVLYIPLKIIMNRQEGNLNTKSIN